MTKVKKAAAPLPPMPTWVGGVSEEMRRKLAIPQISAEAVAAVHARAAEEAIKKRQMQALNRWPVLPLESFVRPDSGYERFITFKVAADKGPASDGERMITLRNDVRGGEIRKIKRCRVVPVPG